MRDASDLFELLFCSTYIVQFVVEATSIADWFPFIVAAPETCSLGVTVGTLHAFRGTAPSSCTLLLQKIKAGFSTLMAILHVDT